MPEKEPVNLNVYHEASLLDPLRLDDVFRVLPRINTTSDTVTLNNILTETLEKASKMTLSRTASIAALRDIDFLISSYRRHGYDPITDIVGLEELLVEIGDKAGTIPRGTVATYALANPKGERERSFTDDQEESLFIGAVRDTSEALEHALITFAKSDAISGLTSLNQGLDVAITSIISVMRSLPPEYFTEKMRPYFDPLIINGKEYLGAGGAQLQFVAIDYILWGADEMDETYSRYFFDNYSYLTPTQQQNLVEIIKKYDGESLLKHIALNDDKDAATVALGVLKKMKKFRYPHRKLAQDNFRIRKEGQVGSGAYTIDILDVLLHKTGQAISVAEGVLVK